VIINFKARLFLDPEVGATKVSQEIKTRVLASLESGAHVDNMLRGNNGGNFFVRLDNFGNPVGAFTL